MAEFELSMMPSDQDDTAVARLRTRYPEIDLIGRYVSTEGVGEMWLCRAPSVAHIARWTDEVGLHVTRIRRLADP